MGERRAWLAAGRDFRRLVANDPAGWPSVVPPTSPSTTSRPCRSTCPGPGIRGLRLHVVDVLARLEFDDHEPPEHCLAVTDLLQQRVSGHDHDDRLQQLRRLNTSRTWPT